MISASGPGAVRLACLAISLGASLAGATGAWAQDVSAYAYTDPARARPGDLFSVIVSVSGVQGLEEWPAAPDLSPHASYRGSSSSTSFQMSGGVTMMSVEVRFQYQAIREGAFEIGSLQMRAGGQALSTDPVEFSVLAQAAPPSSGSAAGPGAAGGQPAVGAAPGGDGEGLPELFMLAEPARTQVLVNEPVLLEYRLFTRRDVDSYNFTDLPPYTGFWVEELDLAGPLQVERVQRGGIQYASAVVRRTVLFPTSTGRKTLEPLSMEARVKDSSNPFGGLGSFGSSLFSRTAPVGVATPPVEIDVLPLPEAGRPPDFTGLVGDLAVAAELDRDSVAANEAVTLTVRVQGRGNMRGLPAPSINFPATVEAFPPETSETLIGGERGLSGSRRFEFVLVPREPGLITIPAVQMGYYDPDADEYRVARAPASRLVVTGGAAGAAGGGEGRTRTSIETLRDDIRFISLQTGRFRGPGDSPVGGAVLWAALLAPAAVVAGAAGLRRRRDRLGADRAAHRDRRASRKARQRLARAHALIKETDSRGCFAEASAALEGFAADKLDVAVAGLVRSKLPDQLRGRGASGATTDRFVALLEECDRQRFAPGTPGTSRQQDVLRDCRKVLSDLERETRR